MRASRGTRTVPDGLIAAGRNLLPHSVRCYVTRRTQRLRDQKRLRARADQMSLGAHLDMSMRPRVNVVIVTIDSLRIGHVSSMGYPRETTPFLDSFERPYACVAASTWTYPSVASILTGLYPHNHNAVVAGKVKDFGRPETYLRLREDVITLPEMLSLLGYRVHFATAIDLAYFPLASRVCASRYPESAKASELLDDLARWIADGGSKPFFAYVHLGDLHVPLDVPAPFNSHFGTVKDIPNIRTWDFETRDQRTADPDNFTVYKENRLLLYDNAIRYVDWALERLYDDLRRMDLTDSTIVVVTADHGEEFWDHVHLQERFFFRQKLGQGYGHGHSVFNEVVEVPLVLSGPVAHAATSHRVSSVDIMPTILDSLRVDHTLGLDGRSLSGTIVDERPLLCEACASGYEKKALFLGRYKLIYSRDDGVAWVFDLDKDPQELNPISDESVTSVFVKKLNAMLGGDERSRIRMIAASRKP